MKIKSSIKPVAHVMIGVLLTGLFLNYFRDIEIVQQAGDGFGH